MKYPILILFLFSISFRLSAQDVDRNEGLYITVQPQLTYHDNVRFQVIQGNIIGNISSKSPRTIAYGIVMEAGYFVWKGRLAVGLGFGIENNYEYRANYLPLYIDIKFFLLESRNTPFLYGNLGKLIPTRRNKMDGELFSIGAGQKVFFTNKLAAIFSLGYSIRNATYSNPNILYLRGYNFDGYQLNAKGFEFKIGLLF